MKHFLRLPDFTVMQLIHQAQFADLWDKGNDDFEMITVREAGEFTDKWDKLPALRPIIFDLMRLTEATVLGEVTIEKVKPGKTYAVEGDGVQRYEVCLQNLPRSSIMIADEQIIPEPGQVWAWKIAGHIERFNGSPDDAVSLIIQLDLK